MAQKWTYIGCFCSETGYPIQKVILVEELEVPPGTPLFDTEKEAVDYTQEHFINYKPRK